MAEDSIDAQLGPMIRRFYGELEFCTDWRKLRDCACRIASDCDLSAELMQQHLDKLQAENESLLYEIELLRQKE